MKPITKRVDLTPIVTMAGSRVYFNVERGSHSVVSNKQGFRLYNDGKQYIDFPSTDEYTLTTLAVSKISIRCKAGEIILLCGDRRRRETILRKIQSKLTLTEQKVA